MYPVFFSIFTLHTVYSEGGVGDVAQVDDDWSSSEAEPGYSPGPFSGKLAANSCRTGGVSADRVMPLQATTVVE